MAHFKSPLLLLILSLLAFSVYSDDDFMGHKCTHDDEDKPAPILTHVNEDFTEGQSHEGRTLASYPNIRMYGYYGLLASTTTVYRSYLQNDLIPPILDYFSAALKVKYPISGNLTISDFSTCGYNTPAILKKGVEADFFYFIQAESSSANYVASSRTCRLAYRSNRPVAAITQINQKFLKATKNVLLHEKNMICIMHELVHTLGFSTSLYNYYIAADGKKLKGHLGTAPLDGKTSKVLNIEPLTSKIRSHFGCASIKGAYMENTGSPATAGSHFERRQFSFEFMTSGLIYQMQVTEFTLALLEGTGWYVPDYSYADVFTWGQGQGCNFLTSSCSASGFHFEEFCKSAGKGCTNPGRGGGNCASDARSDNCYFIQPNINYDCENPNAKDHARMASLQVFGRGEGSKCFSGTLTSLESAPSASFCFKYNCTGEGINTQLTVNVGKKEVVCSSEGKLKVDGLNGFINCPDPLTFCSTVGKKACPRNCMGRGVCNNGVCECNSGYKGTDCALRTEF